MASRKYNKGMFSKLTAKVNTRVLWTGLSFVVIILGTLVAIQYAKGGFRLTRQGFYQQTGLLSANSYPNGAEIKINDKLVSATDDTLYLEPGEYNVEIVKDGFWPWQKNLIIEQELVTQTNARLFPIAPSLAPLTFTGVENIMPSPDGQKLLYYTASASAQAKNGVYVLELSNNFLSLNREARQVAVDTNQLFDFTETEIIWSPDSSEVMLLGQEKEVLLDVSRKSDIATLPDIRFQKRQILSEWQEEMYIRERQFLIEFPDEIIEVATASAQNVYISPDKKRLMYTALEALTLPEGLVPPVPAVNTQPQTRDLEPGNVYIYDREEDTNFLVGLDTVATDSAKQLLVSALASSELVTLEASPSAFQTLQATQSAQTAENFNRYHTPLYTHGWQWFPNSKHILYVNEGNILIKEYDGTNRTTIFSGPFFNSFVYPWPDGSRIVILTTFSPETPINFYSIALE